MTRGVFITFEGIDAVGKSSQIELLASKLRELTYKVYVTREPGGTEIGEYIRKYLKSSEQRLLPLTNAFLFAASRNEHLNTVIIPKISEGYVVLCDRFIDSNLVYQSIENVKKNTLEIINQQIENFLMPDITFLFDLNIEHVVSRINQRIDQSFENSDHFETNNVAYLHKLRDEFLAIAQKDTDRIKIINANRELEKITLELLSYVTVWQRQK